MARKKKTAESAETTPAMQEQAFTVAETEEIKPVEDTRPEKQRTKISITNAEKRKKSSKEIDAQRNLRNITLEMIRGAIYNKTILKNTIGAVEQKLNGVEVACLSFVLPADIKVFIPFNRVFQNDPLDAGKYDLETETSRTALIKRQQGLLAEMNGGSIRWIPEEIIADEENDTVIVVGSRTKALEIDRWNYYLKENPNIKEGNTYPGKIVRADNKGALVALGGVEKYIPQKTLTNRYAERTSDLFGPGDRIYITVRELSVNRETQEISAVFDCLTGELIEAQDKMKNISVGMVTSAVISKSIEFTDEQGGHRTRLYGWIDSWDVPIKINGLNYNRFGIPLKPSDQVAIQITGMDEDGYVTCHIRLTTNTSLL